MFLAHLMVSLVCKTEITNSAITNSTFCSTTSLLFRKISGQKNFCEYNIAATGIYFKHNAISEKALDYGSDSDWCNIHYPLAILKKQNTDQTGVLKSKISQRMQQSNDGQTLSLR